MLTGWEVDLIREPEERELDIIFCSRGEEDVKLLMSASAMKKLNYCQYNIGSGYECFDGYDTMMETSPSTCREVVLSSPVIQCQPRGGEQVFGLFN